MLVLGAKISIWKTASILNSLDKHQAAKDRAWETMKEITRKVGDHGADLRSRMEKEFSFEQLTKHIPREDDDR